MTHYFAVHETFIDLQQIYSRLDQTGSLGLLGYMQYSRGLRMTTECDMGPRLAYTLYI